MQQGATKCQDKKKKLQTNNSRSESQITGAAALTLIDECATLLLGFSYDSQRRRSDVLSQMLFLHLLFFRQPCHRTSE